MEETEFKHKKELIELRHRLKMEEIAQEYENRMSCIKATTDQEKLKHELEKERMRIKSAEIRKNLMRKQAGQEYGNRH